jgi:phenylpropionate dioxygenase-like ring-hydroxylating dioxygenase large terminal subunit
MTIDAVQAREMKAMVDPEKGTVDRRIFSSQDIYELELEQIFARAWNFMCHDTQIPNPGDFFMTFIGEDRVIVVRDNDMQPQVLVNSCRHRGNAVCRAEEGHASSFMCTYHGWTYDLKGALVGVPGFKEVYHEELDRENWGLIKAAQVESYKGFIFANMDETAPQLNEYLGKVGRMSLDLVAERGEVQIAPGIQKYTLPCNWKLAADNVWDFYHPGISHASATMSGINQRQKYKVLEEKIPATMTQGQNTARRLTQAHMILLGDYGHIISGPEHNEENSRMRFSDETWRENPRAQEVLGPVGMRMNSHPHIFPNMWITYPGFAQVSLRLPKGPMTTEIWWFTFYDKKMDAEKKANALDRAMHIFGPAGMLEQDDGENWGESTRATSSLALRKYPLHYGMSIGRGNVIDDEQGPRYIEGRVNEHAQLWHYRSWADWMSASSWDDLRENHSKLGDKV